MIFIDAGPLVARYVKRDQYHERAAAAWEHLSRSKLPWLTTVLVINETITLIARQLGYAVAVEKARTIYDSLRFEILRPTREVELQALELMEKFADQRCGFTDCVSFVLMRKNKLKRAFTFDRHFRTAGFTVWP